MKSNTLKIHIARPIEEVFKFTTDSSKISLWFGHCIEEEIPSETPMRKGTILRNRAPGSEAWSEYKVTDYELNKKFVLSQVDDNYHVRYTYIPSLNGGGTDVIYEEWVENGELENLEPQSTMEKLKFVLENEISERSDV